MGSFACDLHMVSEYLDKQCSVFQAIPNLNFVSFSLVFPSLSSSSFSCPQLYDIWLHSRIHTVAYMEALWRGEPREERATWARYYCCYALGSVHAEDLGWEGKLEVQEPILEGFPQLKINNDESGGVDGDNGDSNNYWVRHAKKFPCDLPKPRIHPFNVYFRVNAGVIHWSTTFVEKSITDVCQCRVLLRKAKLCIPRTFLLGSLRENPLISPTAPAHLSSLFHPFLFAAIKFRACYEVYFPCQQPAGLKTQARSFLWLSWKNISIWFP